MDLLFFVQILKNTLKELWLHKYLAASAGIFLAFSVLIYGIFWQEKYVVSATLYADNQNIIKPLLAGQAQVTTVEDRRQVVRDLMLSERVLEKIVLEHGFVQEGDDAVMQASRVKRLRERVRVKMLGQNYIGVSFADGSQDRAYAVVTELVSFFIQESSATKRSESKKAFMFIDRQANSYKEQLRQAELNLKKFKANNLDGSEAKVLANIEQFRSNIAGLELDFEQAETRVSSLASQVKKEDQYLTAKAKSDGYRERIAEAVAQLDTLRLSLTDNHPDVINLKQYIEGLKESAANPGSSDISASNVPTINPVYDELRAQLAVAKVDKSTIKNRLRSLNKRLEGEFARAKRVAEGNAELSELTRDYDVTKNLYEDFLERKEHARLSMTLDIEGQGVTYKIQEPAKYPLAPTGLRFIHFVILGGIAALIIPAGFAGAYVFVDPRIRFPEMLNKHVEVPVLGVVPHLISNPMLRVRKADIRLLMLMLFVSIGLYFSLSSYVLLRN